MASLIAGRTLLALIATVLSVTSSAATAATSAANRFTIHADLSPSMHVQAVRSGLEMESHLTAVRVPIALSGSDFALTAKLAESPLGCLGDLIFRDNFELPVHNDFESRQ